MPRFAAPPDLSADDTTGVWPIPYAAIRTGSPPPPRAGPPIRARWWCTPTSRPKACPPGALQYPAALLRYVAGPGQTAGLSSGQLPPGYLPMTAANGLPAPVGATHDADRPPLTTGCPAEAVPTHRPPLLRTRPILARCPTKRLRATSFSSRSLPRQRSQRTRADRRGTDFVSSPDKVIHLAAPNSSKTPKSSASLLALELYRFFCSPCWSEQARRPASRSSACGCPRVIPGQTSSARTSVRTFAIRQRPCRTRRGWRCGSFLTLCLLIVWVLAYLLGISRLDRGPTSTHPVLRTAASSSRPRPRRWVGRLAGTAVALLDGPRGILHDEVVVEGTSSG